MSVQDSAAALIVTVLGAAIALGIAFQTAEGERARVERAAAGRIRLAGAVELAFYNAKGRYALPSDLKAAGYLDPKWPRTNPRVYQVDCGVRAEGGFVCFAEPLRAALAEGRPAFPDGAWGRDTLAICLALRASSQERERLMSELAGGPEDDVEDEWVGDHLDAGRATCEQCPGAAGVAAGEVVRPGRRRSQPRCELGIDPVELRRRNNIPPSAMPYKTGLTFTYDSGRFEENMDRAMKLGDWTGFEARRKDSAKRGLLRGIGISNYIEANGGAPREWTRVTVNPEGRVEVAIGTQSSGQSHETSYSQLVNEFLGIPIGEIRILDGAESREYMDVVRAEALRVLEQADLSPRGPALTAGGFVWDMVAQHEAQHDETLLQTLQLMPAGAYSPCAGALPGFFTVVSGSAPYAVSPLSSGLLTINSEKNASSNPTTMPMTVNVPAHPRVSIMWRNSGANITGPMPCPAQ